MQTLGKFVSLCWYKTTLQIIYKEFVGKIKQNTQQIKPELFLSVNYVSTQELLNIKFNFAEAIWVSFCHLPVK